jgi:hypothetical protein
MGGKDDRKRDSKEERKS